MSRKNESKSLANQRYSMSWGNTTPVKVFRLSEVIRVIGVIMMFGGLIFLVFGQLGKSGVVWLIGGCATVFGSVLIVFSLVLDARLFRRIFGVEAYGMIECRDRVVLRELRTRALLLLELFTIEEKLIVGPAALSTLHYQVEYLRVVRRNKKQAKKRFWLAHRVAKDIGIGVGESWKDHLPGGRLDPDRSSKHRPDLAQIA
ncbi:MAG: hypothetical protein A2939_04555 [Parcubacteria group bacterium RIFCSPLOWO2_01_FULL_48_18]|nr:MAG: hypothetical protein A2939_04555 [Parcubacteria group bacterium RIFCSPLOWO2_01_FULL_48_18]OHB24141.1 MAG: hypothetical protein A3J67_01655 [Parcubacteria group bacterium RIFCSPHIGHO2_02_FULL_48_10b]